MNKTLIVLGSAILATAMSGCVVVPARGGYAAPAGVAYVAPLYASPGPGWEWQYHAQYGWGWHHPQYGWHRGWH